jgi:hypothetical protein
MKQQQESVTNLGLRAALNDSDQLTGPQPPPGPSKYALTPAQLDAICGGQVMPYWAYRPTTADRYASALKAGENMMQYHICNMYGICKPA